MTDNLPRSTSSATSPTATRHNTLHDMLSSTRFFSTPLFAARPAVSSPAAIAQTCRTTSRHPYLFRSGFSLIELLVVLTIAAITIAFVLPAIGSAKEDAKRVVCSQNQHQLAVATMALMNNNNGGYFPHLNYTFAANTGAINVLTTRRNDFAGGWDFYSTKMMVCPVDEKPGTVSIRNANNTTRSMQSSYGYHIRMAYNGMPLSSSRLGAPSEVALFYDGSMSGYDSTTGINIEGDYNSTMVFSLAAMNYRHRNRFASGVFVDGHTGAFEFGKTSHFYAFGGGNLPVTSVLGGSGSSTMGGSNGNTNGNSSGNANGNSNGKSNGNANGNSNGNSTTTTTAAALSMLEGVDIATPSRGYGGAGGGRLTTGAIDDERRGP